MAASVISTIRAAAGVLLLAAALVAVAPQRAQASTRAQVMSAAAAYGTSHGVHVGISVYDLRTGQVYGAGDHTGTFASESVVKVLIAARLLATGRMHGTTATRAYYMITHSDDAIASSLYGSVGGDSLINWVKAHWHVPTLGSPPRRAGWWGNTHITSDGLVRLYAKLHADPKVASWLLNAMHHATKYGSDGVYQFFGIPSATTGFGVKQGWGNDYDDWGASADFNTTGYVNNDRYAVAILGRAPISYYGSKIGAVLTGVARTLLPGGSFPEGTPWLHAFSPSYGPAFGGSGVTITGGNLTGITGVYFGGYRASIVRSSAPTSVTVTTPKHAAGRVSLTVVTTHGSVTAHALYAYVGAPSVSAVQPTSGPTTGGTAVTLHGWNFTHVSKVLFGAQPATSIKTLSWGVMDVVAPAHDSSTVDIRVYTAYGTSAVATGDRFTFVSRPTVTAVSPATGPTAGGTPVTLSGANFTKVTAVRFGSVAVGSFTLTSPATLRVTAPPQQAPGAVDIRVGTAYGTSAIAPTDVFTYTGTLRQSTGTVAPAARPTTPQASTGSPATTSSSPSGASAVPAVSRGR